jgi:hypothetical protein
MKDRTEISEQDNNFMESSISKYYPESKFLSVDAISQIIEKKEVTKFSGGYNIDFSVIAQDVLNIAETLSLIITSYYLIKTNKNNKSIEIIIKSEIEKNEILESLEEKEKQEFINEILTHLNSKNGD